ncbi:hypothetical protein LguiB_008940 [Lonicera macranthoides]
MSNLPPWHHLSVSHSRCHHSSSPNTKSPSRIPYLNIFEEIEEKTPSPLPHGEMPLPPPRPSSQHLPLRPPFSGVTSRGRGRACVSLSSTTTS